MQVSQLLNFLSSTRLFNQKSLERDSAQFEVDNLGGIQLIKHRHVLPFEIPWGVKDIYKELIHQLLLQSGEQKQLMTMKVTDYLRMLSELVHVQSVQQLTHNCIRNYLH